MNACPKCKGKQGYQYVMTVEHTMIADGWGGELECGDSGRTTTSLAECLDCGAKFRLSTIERDGGL